MRKALALIQRAAQSIVAALAHYPADAFVEPATDFNKRRREVAAVASYVSGQASSLRGAWDAVQDLDNPALAGEARMLQAGAASAQAMGDLLLAIVTNDKAAFKASVNAFVDDAIAAGVVTVS